MILLFLLVVATCTCEFFQGLVYEQSSYWDTNTKLLNIEQLQQDLPGIVQRKFNQIGFRLEMGDLMLKWAATTGTATYDELYCAKLLKIGSIFKATGMKMVINIHLGEDVPEGFPNATFQHGHTDLAGVKWAGVWKAGPSPFVEPEAKAPLMHFHKYVAKCFKDNSEYLRYIKYSFESCYPQFPWAHGSSTLTEKFAVWAQHTNNNIQHWNKRWAENHTDFNTVLLPAYINPKWQKYWNTTTEKPTNSNIHKWGDFWRFYLIGVLRNGTYGVSIGDFVNALQTSIPTIQTAFKHYKPVPHWFNMTDLTIAELRMIYDLPINVTALGIYAKKSEDLKESYITHYINNVKLVAPKHLPILIWETGSTSLTLGEQGQYNWVGLVNKVSQQEGLIGYDIWNYIDWTGKTAQDYKKWSYHLGMHTRDGKKKLAWDWWLDQKGRGN